ncbi:trimeric intracellular cation channel family protein [Pacificimonas sp. WHA3]|uniref:Trimeric intracellular cation channel family protein n=1 Tax=Pacificimonas pallii TaxID=2827236 RepID=A0ABS6SI60_9SPHN|nr:trimeric intracellular cation channel family protein [Pacificimonas pallii]MBV7257552.1 trimeric intracellular cation channel family protein [Pacificimonas pallii]
MLVETALLILSAIGTAVFAISGALLGLRKGMDIVGVSFVATVTGVGGGTVRDVLLGALPVAWVQQPTDIAICIVCAFLVSALNAALLGQRMTWLLYADAAGLALFAVLGAAKADAAGAHVLVAILFGAMSACFGGIIRDIICGERPILFAKEIYVSAALLSAAVYLLIPESMGFEIRVVAGVLSGLALRILAMHFAWTLPFPRYRQPVS